MTILVTGGAGYIGSHTCVELLNKGYDVVVIDNLVNSSAKAIERVEEITGKRVAFYENDVRDRAALDRIFEKHDINCAIHFAGLKAVGESVAMPLEYYDNNLFSTVTLCEVMREHGVKNIVFSSSATVYSGSSNPSTFIFSRLYEMKLSIRYPLLRMTFFTCSLRSRIASSEIFFPSTPRREFPL